MDPTLMDGLLRAFNLMVLERWPDGSLVAVSTPPEWFGAVSRDGTFPFLGAFLEEAGTFWDAADAKDGKLGSGLCSATAADGGEFHFEAWAVNMGERRFLVLERSDAVALLQDTLQRAREEKLAKAASDKTARDAVLTLHELTREVRTGLSSIRNLVSAADEVAGTPGHAQLLEAIRIAAATLSSRVDGLVGK